MTEHILFDLDHTLWDFDTNSRAAMLSIFGRHRLALVFGSYDNFHRIYDDCNTRLWRSYADGTVAKSDVVYGRFARPLAIAGHPDEALARRLGDEYLRLTSDGMALMPHAIEVLSRLKAAGYGLHIVSNGFREVQYRKIAHSGLGRFLTGIFLSDEIGCMKPHKPFFDHVMARLATTPDRCVLVGDSPESDIAGAVGAGIRPIYYNSRGLACDLPGVRVIASLAELLTDSCGLVPAGPDN